MKAMILGAGLGTRLRPLTDTVPKVLVPVLGIPLLDRLRAWLAHEDATELALNTHHLAEAVRGHVAATAHLPQPRLFHENELLGTGGALVNAAGFWGDAPLLVWNGDIVADVPLADLMTAHTGHAASGALATLVVQARPGNSHLLVDAEGTVCGIDSPRRGLRRLVREPAGTPHPVAFHGVSVLEPDLRAHMPAGGAFDLVDALLQAMEAGTVVRVFEVHERFFGTTGTAEQLRRLERGLRARPTLLARWTP